MITVPAEQVCFAVCWSCHGSACTLSKLSDRYALRVPKQRKAGSAASKSTTVPDSVGFHTLIEDPPLCGQLWW